MNLNPKTICSVLSLPSIKLSFKILSASCVFCTLGRYIDRHSPDVSPTYRPILNRYSMSVGISTETSIEISAECRSIYRLIIGWYLGRYSDRYLADTLTIYCRSTVGYYNPSNSFASTRLVKMHHEGEYSPAKTGEYPRIVSNFQDCVRCEKDLKDNKYNTLHLAENILSLDMYIISSL